LEKNYEVHGIIRRSSSFNTKRINHIFNKLNLYYGDLSDGLCIYHLINKIRPDEIYHLGAQSHVKTSFEIPVYTGDITGIGTIRLLESVKQIDPKIKIYCACSSEMFGMVQEIPQTEKTPFYPRSPYGIAKCCSFWVTKNYREAYNMFACNGILFNHESCRRGGTFVTKKIIDYLINLKENKDPLQLGNLESKRDWGYAPDYVKAMWLMLQQDKPDDFVIATNETHSVREFCEVAFKEVGIDLIWEGKGLEEKGINKKTGEILIEINSKYFRPAEVDILQGDYSKAKKILGWDPKVKFNELIHKMIHDKK
jgi:GDPmannose 4,6-dehydratase